MERMLVDESPIEINESSLQIPPTWAHGECRHTFPLRNAGAEAIIVERIAADCACTSVVPSELVLASGESRNVEVAIDLKRVKGRVVNRTEQAFDSTLSLVTNRGAQRIVLNGTVRLPYVLSEDPIRIAAPIRYGTPPNPTQFTIWKHPSIEGIQVGVPDGDGEIREVADGAHDGLAFEFLPNSVRMLGPFQSILTISGVADDGAAFASREHRIAGRVDGDVVWSPESVLLFAGLRTRAPLVDVKLTSRTSAGLAPIEVESVPDFLDVAIKELHSSESPASEKVVEIRAKEDLGNRSVASGLVLLRVRSAADAAATLIPIPVTIQSVATTVGSDSSSPEDDR